jgi:site-specific DNA recombinase
VSSSASGERLDRVSARNIEALLASALARLLPDASEPMDLVARVQLADGELVVSLPARLARIIKRHLLPNEAIDPNPTNPELTDVRIAASLGVRHANATIRPASGSAGRRDAVLIKALRTAHSMIAPARNGVPLIEIVPGPRYQRRLLRLAFLSPEIQRAILAGRQPAGLRLEDLVRNPMPTAWDAQQEWINRLAG